MKYMHLSNLLLEIYFYVLCLFYSKTLPPFQLLLLFSKHKHSNEREIRIRTRETQKNCMLEFSGSYFLFCVVLNV